MAPFLMKNSQKCYLYDLFNFFKERLIIAISLNNLFFIHFVYI
jgi:hypothetical protein